MAAPLIRDAAGVVALVEASPALLRWVREVAALALPDCWLAAGAVRNAVWDAQCGFPPGRNPPGDVDAVWFDPRRAEPETDAAAERALTAACPGVSWQVRNQARMHLRSGDPPFTGTLDAMRHWPETATAVGVRLGPEGLEVAAPFGLADLLDRVVRPTPTFERADRREVVAARVAAKGWARRWPGLRLAGVAGDGPGG